MKKINYKNIEFPIFLCLLIISFFLYLFEIKDNISIYDEGIILNGSSQVLHGLIPYRDFWTIYAPSQFYLVAGWMYIFGESILSERILSLIIFIISSIFLYKFLIKTNWKYKLFPVIAFLIFGLAFKQYGRSFSTALLLIFIGLYLFNISIEKYKKKYYLILGIISGFLILFRQDIGLIFFISILISYIIYFKKIKYKYIINNGLRNNYFFIFKFILGFLIVFIPISIYFLIEVPISDLYNQLYYIPRKIFPDYRNLPFPIPEIIYTNGALDFKLIFTRFWLSLAFWGSLLIISFETYILIKKIIQRKLADININYLLILFLSYSGVLYSLVRTDKTHIFYLNICVLIIICYRWDFIIKNFKLKILSIIFCLLILSFPLSSKINSLNSKFNNTYIYSLDSPKAKDIKLSQDFENYNELLKFIDSCTSSYENIFSANYTQQTIFLNDVLIYFLSDRKPASKYSELHPGVATTEKIQLEIINSLKINKNRIIVKMLTDTAREYNLSSVPSGVKNLDNYIDSNYILIKDFKNYQVLETKKEIYNKN